MILKGKRFHLTPTQPPPPLGANDIFTFFGGGNSHAFNQIELKCFSQLK